MFILMDFKLVILLEGLSTATVRALQGSKVNSQQAVNQTWSRFQTVQLAVIWCTRQSVSNLIPQEGASEADILP